MLTACRLSRPFWALCLAAVAACGRAPLIVPATPSAVATKSQPRVLYGAPRDFVKDSLTLTLRASPEHFSYVFVVPAITVHHWRDGEKLDSPATYISVDVLSPTQSGVRPLHALPTRKWLAPPPVTARPGTPVGTAMSRDYYLRAPGESDFQTISAKRLAVQRRWELWQNNGDPAPLSPDEARFIVNELDKGYDQVTAMYGDPTDVDGDGRISLVIGTGIRGIRDDRTEGLVDRCYLTGAAPCSLGDVVFAHSPAAYVDGGERRGYYIAERIPRVALHEMVHLTQAQRLISQNGKYAVPRVPSLYREGSAEALSFEHPFGQIEQWHSLLRINLRSDASPFAYPYTLGGLFHWWLGYRFGPGAYGALWDALASSAIDPFSGVFGVEEPLLFGMMWASLALDGTDVGANLGLRLPEGGRPEPATRPYLDVLRLGGHHACARGYSGAARYKIFHEGPVTVRVSVADPRHAFVVVVEP